jgi:hypothetical protein
MLSIGTLSPYYDAIYNHIRPALQSLAKSIDPSLRTGFDDCAVNPWHDRTPQFMFLEKRTCLGKETIKTLFTPLGGINLLSSGNGHHRDALSKQFLSAFDWDIRNVTSYVLDYEYIQEEDKIAGPTDRHSDSEYRIYVIERVGKVQFTPKIDQLVTFSYVHGNSKQEVEDKRILDQLNLSKVLRLAVEAITPGKT